MISKTAQYALCAITCLANQEGTRLTTAQIADATRTPFAYLARVMMRLSRVGLVSSERGPNGGFTLDRDPAKLTLLEIINAVDTIRRFEECPLGLPTHANGLCRLHRRLDQLAQMLEQFFADTTVAQMLDVPTDRRPLCRCPSAPKSTT
jgi:Rrf2 family transcriptional regulator, nitric oxide-sensitive transcriptional repressor